MKTRDMAMLLTLAWTGLLSSAYAQGEGTSVLKLPQDIESRDLQQEHRKPRYCMGTRPSRGYS